MKLLRGLHDPWVCHELYELHRCRFFVGNTQAYSNGTTIYQILVQYKIIADVKEREKRNAPSSTMTFRNARNASIASGLFISFCMRGDWLSAMIEGERGSSSALRAGVVDNHITLRGGNGRVGKCTRA